MRILKVWDYEYPWDVRTEKVCRALTEAGHDVHMIARNRKRQVLEEVLDEASVHRMRPWPWLGRHLDAASQFPAFVNPRWSSLARRTATRNAVELVVVRDIPLAPVAIRVARRLRVPVILDMAEHYAALVRDLWNTKSTKFGDVLIRNPKAVEAVERWVLKRVDHTTVVVEESRDRLIAEGVPPEKVSVVSNTPYLSRVEEYARLAEEERAERQPERGGNGKLRLVYLGVMEQARGVGYAIEAVAAARAAGTDVTLELIGDGRSLEDFKAMAARLGLSGEAFRSHGFVEYRKALGMVSRADAGLIPHFASESWESTIPNKLFDYMSLAVPVISSDVTPVERVLDETGAGVTFRDRDAADLARVIRELAADPARDRMGQRGIEAVRARYNWDFDAEILRTVVDGVTRQRASPRA